MLKGYSKDIIDSIIFHSYTFRLKSRVNLITICWNFQEQGWDKGKIPTLFRKIELNKAMSYGIYLWRFGLILMISDKGELAR